MAGRTRSQPRDAPSDCTAARRLLDQAEKHLRSANVEGVDSESRYGMLYDDGRKACDAVLHASGRRLTVGLGHHVQYIAEARRLLGADDDVATLLARLETARAIGNTVQYDMREVSGAELEDLREAVAAVVRRARAHVDEICG